MYYLKPDGFSSALLTSDDLLSWKPAELVYTGGKLANYFVLGVIEDEDSYRSWFGYGTSMASSVGQTLHSFSNAGYKYSIGLDIMQYPSGSRDPYIFYDPQADVYRVICTAYLTNQLQGKGQGMKCMLAIGSTRSASLDDWGKIDKTLINFDGLKGEPECAQVFLINDRWYVFASMARRHPNHVGRLSYWIGDEGKGLLDQDWNQKEEHYLTSEDLCAAQLVEKEGALYVWGWIAKSWEGGTWGGDISLPLVVLPGTDGLLYTSLAPEVRNVIRGELSARSEGVDPMVSGEFFEYDADVSVINDSGRSFSVNLGAAVVNWNHLEHQIEIQSAQGLLHTSLPLPAESLSGQHTIRILGQEDVLEVFVDDKWSICARINSSVNTHQMYVTGSVPASMTVYRLASGTE